MEQRRFALLIDSENISAKYIDSILQELTQHGIITYKRIYGDWSTTQATKWREKIAEYSLTPIQQFRNTIGKNSTDSALIIDAMDILYTNKVEGFCIVSSDGDFTRLACRLREAGMSVIGMGEEKCPHSFRVACSLFVELQIKQDEYRVEEKVSPLNKNEEKKAQELLGKQAIQDIITQLIKKKEKEGKTLELGELGAVLSKQYPGFKVKHYGYSLLSKFLQDMGVFEVTKVKNKVSIRLKSDDRENEELQHYIKSILGRNKSVGIELSQLESDVLKKYKELKLEKYGDSNFRMLISNIEGVVIKQKNGTPENKQIAYLKRYV